ncbi:MAG: DUF1326 domain-containing protein [Acidobacteriota bacterium]
MKKSLFVTFFLACGLWAPLSARDAVVSGDYLEVRTSDVYTGPCFANSEVNLAGKEAIMAWRVRQGSWEGVAVDGLSVVAVIRARATLGDPFGQPFPARAVLVVDQRASARERRALVGLARSMAGPLLKDIVRVEQADIDFVLGRQIGQATLRAGSIAEFKTRPLNEGDQLCGNEIVYYPPLVDVEATPAYTLVHNFHGQGLSGNWSSPFKRSAFVGTFQR